MIVEPSVKCHHPTVGKHCRLEIQLGSFMRDEWLMAHADIVSARDVGSLYGMTSTRLTKFEHFSMFDGWTQRTPQSKLNTHCCAPSR